MRLLDTTTGLFTEFSSSLAVRYAILSHVWDANGEQSYADVREIQISLQSRYSRDSTGRIQGTSIREDTILGDPRISAKIRNACAFARANGYQYLWIDTCCIDKSSSAELSEAINSMFRWYRDADVCYAYLADVPVRDDPRSPGSSFSRSRWFTRGWTLQELIALHTVAFLSDDWELIGGKQDLWAAIELVTGIEQEVIFGAKPLRAVSVAKRMSWAAERITTRVEDEAYSLMGIFDINMPTLYGEGRRAFHRLQEEILRRVPDQSIFAWGTYHREPLSSIHPSRPLHLSPTPHVYSPSFLAPSPLHFRLSRNVNITVISPQELIARLRLSGGTTPGSVILSSFGVYTHMPLMSCNHIVTPDVYPKSTAVYLAVLACEVFDRQNPSIQGMLAAICYADPPKTESPQADMSAPLLNSAVCHEYKQYETDAVRLVVLSNDDLAISSLITSAEVKGVYIHAAYVDAYDHDRHQRTERWKQLDSPPPERFVFARRSEIDLHARGYSIYHDPTLFLDPNDDGVLIVTDHRESCAIIRIGDFWGLTGGGREVAPSRSTLARALARYPAKSVVRERCLDLPEVATVLLPPPFQLMDTRLRRDTSDSYRPVNSYWGTLIDVSFCSRASNLSWKVTLSQVGNVWFLEIVPPPSGPSYTPAVSPQARLTSYYLRAAPISTNPMNTILLVSEDSTRL